MYVASLLCLKVSVYYIIWHMRALFYTCVALPSCHWCVYAGKTVPEADLKVLLEDDMSEEALQEEKETEIMLDCNEKFNEVWCVLLCMAYRQSSPWLCASTHVPTHL